MKAVSRNKRRLFKPQIGFRWLFLVFTVTCVGFGVYMANRSVTFSIPAVMFVDEQTAARVSSVTEHKAWWVGSVKQNAKESVLRDKIAYGLPDPEDVTPELEAARVKFLLDDLDRIHHRSKRDCELIDRHAKEFKVAAIEAIAAPKHFPHAASAAAVLAQLGEPHRLAETVDRYVAAGSSANDLYEMCICFSRQQTAAEPKFVEALRAHIGDPNCSDQHRDTFAEQLSEIDPELYESVQWRLAKGSAILDMRDESIVWLIENRPNDEAVELAMQYLSEPAVQKEHYYCVRVLNAVLKSSKFRTDDPAFQKRFVPLAEKLATQHTQCLSIIVDQDGSVFDPFIRKVIAEPKSGKHLSLAFSAAESWFANNEYISLLRKSFESSKYAESIFDRCVRSLGKEPTLEIVKSRWQIEKAHWMFMRICEHSPPENDDITPLFFTAAFEAVGTFGPDLYSFKRRRRKFEVLNISRESGHHELASNLAKSDPELNGYYFVDSLEAQQWLDWFNNHFELETPLTAKMVSDADKKANLSLCEIEGVFEMKTLKIAAFQAAGFGRVVDPENHLMDGGLFAEICELAVDQLEIKHHDMINGHQVRLWIDKYVYEFQMSDDWSWYENAPACDLLNAILERRHSKERFFVFKEAYGNSYVRFVLFAEPLKVKAFLKQYPEFQVEDGCETYWGK